MKVAFVLSAMFGDTRDFLRVVAQSDRVTARLIKGDEPAARALRLVRHARRVWFEGAGPLLFELLSRPGSAWVPRGVLRVGERDLARLPLPQLWRRVSDLIVPTPSAAERFRASAADVPQTVRIHVQQPVADRVLGRAGPLDEFKDLCRILRLPADGAPLLDWQRIILAGDVCRGNVLVVGDPPAEFLDYLAGCVGCRCFTQADDLPAGRADAVVLWEAFGPAEAPQRVAEAIGRLRESGKIVAVAPPEPARGQLPARELARLLREADAWPHAVDVALTGPVAIAMPAAAPAAADGPRVEVTGEAPSVTAIVPVYNDPAGADRAVASLRRQTYPKLDILVVDDGSTDETAQAVKAHLGDPRVRYLYKAHSGRPDTRNLGIEKATGAYLAWLDGDDEATPNRVQAQVEAVMRNPAIDLVHSDALFLGDDGGLQSYRRYRAFTQEELPSMLLQDCPILNTTVMVRKALHDRLGLYDRSYPRGQDYDFFVRCAVAGDVVYEHLPLPLVKVFHDRTPRVTAEAWARGLDVYLRLAQTLIKEFGVEGLVDEVARDLQESPYLVTARQLLTHAISRRASLGHPLLLETTKYLEKAIKKGSRLDQAASLNLLGLLAQYAGDKRVAEARFRQAMVLDPDLLEAGDNLRAMGAKDTADDHVAVAARV